MKVKPSRYNILHSSENGNLLVFNSKSGAALCLDEDKHIEKAKIILLNDVPSLYDEELFKVFTELGLLINIDSNETEEVIKLYNENFQSNKKLHITIFPTLKCNFNCSYCFVDAKFDIDMQFNTLDAILLYIENKMRINQDLIEIEIVWFGGEPLLAKSSIIYFMQQLNKINTHYNKIVSSVLVTNGYLLNIESFKQLHEVGIVNYQVTFDGYKTTHDKKRHLNNGFPTFDVILTNLLTIKKAFLGDFKINIRSNFMKDTVQSQYQLIDCLLDQLLNDNRFSVEFKPIQDILGNGLDNICSVDTNGDLVISFTRYIAESIKKMSNLVYSYSLLPSPIKKWCNASLNDSIIIKPNGEIYACDSCVSDKSQIIGKITDDGTINYTDVFGKWKGNVQLEKECLACILLPLCMGGCKRKRLQNNAQCPINTEQITKYLENMK